MKFKLNKKKLKNLNEKHLGSKQTHQVAGGFYSNSCEPDKSRVQNMCPNSAGPDGCEPH